MYRKTHFSTLVATVRRCDGSDGWDYSQASDICVKLFPTALTWQQAAASCEAIGAQLAAWKDQDSINVFKDLVQNSGTGEKYTTPFTNQPQYFA